MTRSSGDEGKEMVEQENGLNRLVLDEAAFNEAIARTMGTLYKAAKAFVEAAERGTSAEDAVDCTPYINVISALCGELALLRVVAKEVGPVAGGIHDGEFQRATFGRKNAGVM